MNNKLTLIAVVTLNAAAVVSIIGCRSTSGMEPEPNRAALTGTTSGFTVDAGNNGFSAGPSHSAPAVTQTAPESVAAAPTHAASAADAPMGAIPDAPPSVASSKEPVVVSSSKSVETTPAVTLATADEPKAAGAGSSYVVKSNDSLWVIARREKVSIDELAAANGIKRNAILKPGQKLVIPASTGKKTVEHSVGSAAPKKGVVAASGDGYTVVSGDALSIVAHKLHTTTAALRAANPQLKGDALRVGQKLNVPNGSKAPAAAAPAATTPVKPSTGAAPASVPATGAAPAKPSAYDLPTIAPLGGASAPASVPSSGSVPSSVPSSGSTEPIDATPGSR